MQFADLSFALLQNITYAMTPFRAMNWWCMIPCCAQVLAAKRRKYRVILRKYGVNMALRDPNSKRPRSCCTQMIQMLLHGGMLMHRDAFTHIPFMHRRFYQGRCYKEELSHTQRRAGISTQMPSHSVACTQCCMYTMLFHRDSRVTEYPLKTEASTQTNALTRECPWIETISCRGCLYTQIL